MLPKHAQFVKCAFALAFLPALVLGAAGQGAPKRPQTPQPPFPYQERAASFENKADHTRLAGTLTLPANPVAAVLLVPGTGPADRDQTMLGHKPFLVFADYLSRRGVAVLRLDSRGVGGSSGDVMNATLDDLAQDAASGVAWLRSQPELRRTRIGVLGTSMGGLVAALAAQRSSDVAFVVTAGAPGLPDRDVAALRIANELRSRGMSEADAQRYVALFHDVLTRQVAGEENDVVRRELRELTQVLYPMGALKPEELNALVEQQVAAAHTRFWKSAEAADPRAIFAALRCPVLAVAGSLDRIVPREVSLPQLRQALAKNPQASFVEIEGVNHLLQPATTGSPTEIEGSEITVAPTALETIGDFVIRQGGRGPTKRGDAK